MLETGLDREKISILLNLCELGVNPEALAAIVKELRKEAAVTPKKVISGFFCFTHSPPVNGS